MPTTAEQEIYSRLTSAPTFHPANAVLFQRDWTLEPGDVVTVNSGENSYSLPIYALKLNWMGSDQSTSANADRIKASIESTGNEKREPLPELRRKEYQTARSSYGYYRAQQQEIDEHYRHLTETTDRGMAEAFGIIGVKLGPDGMPLKDANGNYIWDDSGTGGEIWGHLNRDAWSTQIMHHIKDENGNILSLAEVYTDAYGNAIINAINNDNTGTATIKANRIKLITTHTGSGGETVYHGLAIDTDGSMYFDATGAVFEINASTATINASHIKLNATDTITLNALLGIEANTQQLRVIGDLYVDNTVWATDISALSSIHSDITIDAPTIEGGYGRFQNLYCKSTFDQYGELTGGEDVSAAFKDMQFIVDPQNSGHFILQGKTLANPNTWVNVTNFNIAATQFFQDSVAARTAHSISRIDLGSGDTGQSTQTVTVYSTDDHEEDVRVTVDASAVYTAGQNDVTIIKGTWGNGITDGTRKVEFTKSAGTQYTENVVLSAGNESWGTGANANQVTVPILDNGSNTGLSVVVDATDRYNAGWGAAYAKVDLPDPLTGLESNDTLTMDVKVPAQTVGTDATTTYALSATQWNGNTAFAKLKAGNDDILRLTLDATPRYRAGSYAVTLNNPDWGTAPNPLTNSRTVSVSTSGRVDSNGTAANLAKAIALYLTQGSFDSAHKLTVSLRDTSSSGTVRAETEVDASGIYSDGQDSVNVSMGNWSNGSVTFSPSVGAGNSKTLVLSEISGSNSITSNGTYTYKVMYEDVYGNDQETGLTKSVSVNVSGGGSIVVNDIQLNASSYAQGKDQGGQMVMELGNNSDGTYPVEIFTNTSFQLNKWYGFRITVGNVYKNYYFKTN